MPWGLSTGNHAADSQAALDKPQEMTALVQREGSSSRLLKEQPTLGEEDVVHSLQTKERLDGDETPTRRKVVDKKSWDYIVKSGVAGGVAACAVCDFNTSSIWLYLCRPNRG